MPINANHCYCCSKDCTTELSEPRGSEELKSGDSELQLRAAIPVPCGEQRIASPIKGLAVPVVRPVLILVLKKYKDVSDRGCALSHSTRSGLALSDLKLRPLGGNSRRPEEGLSILALCVIWRSSAFDDDADAIGAHITSGNGR